MRRVKVAVLISGRGSNMEALIEAAKDPDYPAEIVLVLSNNPDAGGLATAAAQGIETAAIDHRAFGKDREAHERMIDARLRQSGVELVALAGYMRVLTPYLVRAWAGRMLNIHPSLLPLYPGLHTHERAIAAGDAFGGCTVHYVTEGVDEGPIVGQARAPILAGDTADDLAARVLVEEHRLYPACLAAEANKRLAAVTDQRFSSDDEVRALAEAFIARTLPKADWTHAAHVAASVYLIRARPDLAPERDMPGLIRTYNAAVGGENTDTAGYHETITQAYLAGARAALKDVAAEASLHEAVNAVLDAGLDDKDWPLRFWRRETLFSVEARRGYVPPDLKSLAP